MCADLLTDDQLEAPKRGFGLPVAAWMKGPLADVRAEALSTLVATGIASKDGVDAIEHAYLDDTYRSGWTRVWSLVTLGHWLNEHSSTVRLE
jgi:hypothetical protein